MRKISLLSATLLAAFWCLIVFGGTAQKATTQEEPTAGAEPSYTVPPGAEAIPGEIVVKLEPEAAQSDLTALNRENDATTEENLPRSDVNLVDLPRGLTVSEAVREYRASPDVAYAEPNFRLYPTRVPNDTYYARNLWGLNNTGQAIGGTAGTPDADIDAPEAWDTTTGDPGVVVAVIDEGVDVNHPDLKGNIWINADEAPGNGVDDDRNGYVDDVNGFDFAGDDAGVYDPDPLTGDGDEHGTHVAGTIAAVGNNGAGVTGVAWQARIASLKFLGANGGSTLDAIEAINYAVNNGIEISNNSWGGGGYSRGLRDAIANADAKGHLFVAAAGNGGADGVGDNNDTTPSYPASYDLPNVVSVAASDNRDGLGSFSNFGATSVDLAAPGVNIASTLPQNGYGYLSGTSMATPHVTGVAALLKGRDASLDDAALRSRILGSVEKKPAFNGKVSTGGRLNAAQALGQAASQAPAPAPSTEPAPNPPATTSADTTRPTVSAVAPTRTRDRTPLITATVRDDRTNLQKANVRLFVDNRARGTFAYSAARDRLRYTSSRLPYGRHTVKIVARDAAGNAVTRVWAFRVVR